MSEIPEKEIDFKDFELVKKKRGRKRISDNFTDSNLPVVVNTTGGELPIEEQIRLGDELEIETAYLLQKDKAIEKEYNMLNSKLRKMGEYLFAHQSEDIALSDVADFLGITISSVSLMLSKLNFFRGFGLRFIPIPKRAGFIQLYSKHLIDYEKWDLKKMRTISSMTRVRENARIGMRAERRFRRVERVRKKQEQQQEQEN